MTKLFCDPIVIVGLGVFDASYRRANAHFINPLTCFVLASRGLHFPYVYIRKFADLPRCAHASRR